MAQQFLQHNNQLHVQTDFTYPPPPLPPQFQGFWPRQTSPYAWQGQFRMPSPMPQTMSTVTNTTMYNNNSPVLGSFSSSTYRSPDILPCWTSFNAGLKPTPYHKNTQRTNYPRQYSQHYNGHFIANPPQIPSLMSIQTWPQHNQRPQYIPRQHKRTNSPCSSVKNQSYKTNQGKNAVKQFKTLNHKTKLLQSRKPKFFEKPWNREDAMKALSAEAEVKSSINSQKIMIKFPDSEISQDIVKNLHSDIKSVYFHTPCNTRYCYVRVQPSANIENVATALNETVFQHDKLQVEIEEKVVKKVFPECIDPYTLYLGYLPINITINAIKDEFPKAYRVVIGYGKIIVSTRYALVYFFNVEDAIQAYKEKFNLVIESQSTFLRFKRIKRNPNPPGKIPIEEMNEFDIQSVKKKIKREPAEQIIDEFDPPQIKTSELIKHEIIEEDEYDSVHETKIIPNENDINIKSDHDDDFDELYDDNYYEEQDPSLVTYTFRRNEYNI